MKTDQAESSIIDEPGVYRLILSGGTPTFEILNPDGSLFASIRENKNAADNAWHNLAVTFDPTAGQIQDETNTPHYTDGMAFVSSYPLFIGGALH